MTYYLQKNHKKNIYVSQSRSKKRKMIGNFFYKTGGGRIFALFPDQEEYLTNDKWQIKGFALKKMPINSPET